MVRIPNFFLAIARYPPHTQLNNNDNNDLNLNFGQQLRITSTVHNTQWLQYVLTTHRYCYPRTTGVWLVIITTTMRNNPNEDP